MKVTGKQSAQQALAGIRVLDLTQILAGPYCTMLLGDLGADVIKVERPGEGDETHRMGPMIQGGESGSFLMVNRNKRSLALNLKAEEGRRLFLKLAQTADVIVENNRPGKVKELGIDYDTIRAVNPGIIYCSVSGFGQTGPYAHRGGFDIIAQAMTGIMSVTGEEGRPPVKTGIAITDLVAALTALYAILAALIARTHTGEGQFVETSLFEAGLALCVWEAATYFGTSAVPGPLGASHRLAAPYQAFRAQDKFMIVGAASQRTWIKFCEAVERPEWTTDERFQTNADRMRHKEILTELIESHLQSQCASYWLQRLEQFGVPCGPINTFAESLTDPHVEARQMVMDMHHPTVGNFKVLRMGAQLYGTPAREPVPAPLLGQHTREILTEMGLADQQIDHCLAAGVISQS